jgi:hypothetical protein
MQETMNVQTEFSFTVILKFAKKTPWSERGNEFVSTFVSLRFHVAHLYTFFRDFQQRVGANLAPERWTMVPLFDSLGFRI